MRAYATNAVGTAYGSNKSFTTGLPNRIYVDSAGICGGRAPCHNKVQNGVGAAGEASTVLVMQGSYPESLGVNINNSFNMEFGCSSDYTSCVSSSTIGDLTVSGGPVTIGGQLNIAGTTSSQGLAGSEKGIETKIDGTGRTPFLTPAPDTVTVRPGSPEKTLFDLIMAGFIAPHLDAANIREQDREALEGIVRHFYLTILERVPEQWVLNLWVSGYLGYYAGLGLDIRQIAGQMGRMIFLSGEYAGKRRNDMELISDCSKAFLLDERSKEELPHISGLTREQIIALASSSYELDDWIKNTLLHLRGEPVKNTVSYLFTGLLGRLPWEGEINQGQETIQSHGYLRGSIVLGDGLCGCKEFKETYPSYLAQAERIYRTFSGRFLAVAELEFFAGELESGTLMLGYIISGLADGDDFGSILSGLGAIE